MSEIIKTEAVVLNKFNYGDTSLIVSLYTKEMGKISAILKGGRSPKAKSGTKADPLNYVEIVFYNKPSRELQIISSIDIIEHYPTVKNDLDKLRYALSVLELLKNLTVEHEQNLRLFKGIIRIFELMETSNESANIIFARFFLFFLDELGYQIQLDKCVSCESKELFNRELSYNFELGILCDNCKKDYLESFSINQELFGYLISLRSNKKINDAGSRSVDKAIVFMEKYLKYHVPDFKGIQSIKLYK